MLSILIPVRNATAMAYHAFHSVWASIQLLRIEQSCEIVAIDDASDPECQIPQFIQSFRQNVQCPVIGFRLRERRHYTFACALGLSIARGNRVMVVSHDMVTTPAYIRTMLAVAALDPAHGVVRGTSRHIDGFPQHVIHPSLPLRSFADVVGFSDFVAKWAGLSFVEDHVLIGDSMLITRAALDKVGVMDTGFVGFLGDIDFGLRVQRAGFKLVCAKGAWLHHEGSGLTKTEAAAGKGNPEQIHTMHRRMVDAAYVRFRSKWGGGLPFDYPGIDRLDFSSLRGTPSAAGGDFQPPISPQPGVCEML